MTEIKIPAGTIVNYSELGYYNFYYPSRNTTTTVVDCDAHDLGWIRYDNKLAVKLVASQLDDDRGVGEGHIVVWIPVAQLQNWKQK
jgi:hypothetical protein